MCYDYAMGKGVTPIDNGAKESGVIEGFFSFLSHLALYPDQQHLTNFLVLNSLFFFGKSRPVMEKQEAIHLCVDGDMAGMNAIQKALKWNSKYVDQSQLYKNHKDLNECWSESRTCRSKAGVFVRAPKVLGS